MTAEYRNNSIITVTIWISAFLSLIVILAWEFGWVSTDVPQAEISTDQEVEIAKEESKTLSDEITESEAAHSEDNANHEVAKISDEELDQKLFALSHSGNNQAAETETSVVTANRKATPKEPAIFIPDTQKPIEEASAGAESPENIIVSEGAKPSEIKLVSAENKAPTGKELIIESDNSNEELDLEAVEENLDELLIIDDETTSPGEVLPPEIAEIDELLEQGKYIAAHRQLSSIYWQKPELKEHVMPRINENAHRIYFAPQPHFMEPHIIVPGDEFWKMGERYKITWQYLSRLNQVAPEKLQPDQKIKVIKGPFSAVVDLSDYTLTVHAHGYYVREYPVGIGKDDSTPIGKFKVLNKVANPQYTNPEGVVIDADDPQNPLGEHWIDLGDSYGIHGTIDPDSIGKSESRGCIRMRKDDVEEVYHFLINDSEVIIKR